jgi:DNA-binding LacI/PurR family transcriptional regulator/DNA-binding transcriptional regulator YhcF (GntR family)
MSRTSTSRDGAGGCASVAIGPASEKAARRIRQWIRVGDLELGQFVPSERDLAAGLKVARGTVRAALSQLEQEGLIDGSNGGRRVVASRSDGRGLMTHTIAVMTTNPKQLAEPAEHVAGWERFIEVGAIEEISRAKLHALALYTDRLLSGGTGPLLHDLPRAIVVSRRAIESPPGRQMLAALAKVKASVVLYGQELEMPFDCVASDHARGACDLAKWLIAQGRRRILRLWSDVPPDTYWLRGRDAGYERAMREAGLDILPPVRVPEVCTPSHDPPGFEAQVRLTAGYLLDHCRGERPVDAIMAISDGAAFAIAAACDLLGRRANDDVLIVGYDNYWAEAPQRAHWPFVPAATVDKLNRHIGARMVRVAMARADGRLPPEPQRVLVAPELVIPD